MASSYDYGCHSRHSARPTDDPLVGRFAGGRLSGGALGALLLGGLLLPPVGYLLGAAVVGLSRRWTRTARLALAALPAVVVTGVVIVLLARGNWYTPADLFSDPRQVLVGIRHLATVVLPFTALQVLALLAVRLTPGHFDWH